MSKEEQSKQPQGLAVIKEKEKRKNERKPILTFFITEYSPPSKKEM